MACQHYGPIKTVPDLRGSREEWDQLQKAAISATTPQHEMQCMAATHAILNQIVHMRGRIEDISGVIIGLGAALNGKHRTGKPECPENRPMPEGAIPRIRCELDARGPRGSPRSRR